MLPHKFSIFNLALEYNKNKVVIDNYLNNNVIENYNDENYNDENYNDENSNDENSNAGAILGLGIGIFITLFIAMISIFFYTVYLIFTSDLSFPAKIMLILLLLFSGPVSNVLSVIIIVYLKNLQIKSCLSNTKKI